jgi:hypothetical protein
MQNSIARRQLLIGAGSGLLAAAWENLIGSDLAGWKVEGKADWRVEDGAIIGRQGPGGAAGDLFSIKTWTDLELECEWRMKFPGNSGIWFRYMGPKTGYQADFLDQPSHPGVLSGSLYCMGKAFIAENRDAASVRKEGWNRMRVTAKGDQLTIVMNGRRVIAVSDGTFRGPGSVGIQVHAGEAYAGMEVRIRKLRIRTL